MGDDAKVEMLAQQGSFQGKIDHVIAKSFRGGLWM
jgi:hypothetical protein